MNKILLLIIPIMLTMSFTVASSFYLLENLFFDTYTYFQNRIDDISLELKSVHAQTSSLSSTSSSSSSSSITQTPFHLQQPYLGNTVNDYTTKKANNPPIPNIDAPSNLFPGEIVVLDASKSYDKDGKITNFLWTQVDGPQVGSLSSGPVVKFKVPPSQSNFPSNAEDISYLQILLTVQDNGGLQSSIIKNIAIEKKNDMPVVYSQSVSTRKDTPILITLRGTDTNGDPLVFFPSLLSSKTLHGDIRPVNENKVRDLGDSTETTSVILYTPEPGFTGIDFFRFQATDNKNLASNIATISIAVN